MSVIALLVVSGNAFAAADVSATITAPTGAYVYDSETWTVTVSNVGNQTASGVSLVIDLPETNTSPGVYVMGTLGTYSSTCTLASNTLTCSLGTMKRRTTKTVTFDIALPESAGPIEFTATASTTSSETVTSNNADTETASLNNYDVSATAPFSTTNRHCTGTGLESFFECELFPSSITEHDADFAADGTISFPTEPDYSGIWWSDSADHIAFQYTLAGDVVAEFEGWGVSSTCWEGLTTFPGSPYVSPYEVCIP